MNALPPSKPDGRQRPSVYEVAERAGVSIATVSRVLRDSAPVAAATRERVLAAADELRWRPSRLAHAFAVQSHGAVGIVFPDLAGPYFSRVISGFEHEAAERRSAALILGTHGRANAEELVVDLADRVDGLVVMGRTVSDDLVTTLARREIPVVLLARHSVGGVPAVRTDNLGAADVLTRHLLDHGRRRLAFVGEPRRSPDVTERWRGVRRALRRAGTSASGTLVPCGGFDVDHGYKAGLDLFAGRDMFDAVMCANDEVAVGVIRAADASAVRVPDDIAVTGWDDTLMASRLHPSVTTVRQPMRELGAQAAALLFDRIAGEAVEPVVLRTTLVVRESCGCARPIETEPGTDGGRP